MFESVKVHFFLLLSASRYAASDNYANEKLDASYSDSPYGRTKNGLLATGGPVGPPGPDDPYGDATYGKRSAVSASGYDDRHYGTAPGRSGPGAAAEFQRMGRMRSEFYSPQYNASYNQQNGCSIAPGGAGGQGGYHGSNY